MQLNLAQFLGELVKARGFLSLKAGVVTFENGDTFDFAGHTKALHTLASEVQHDLNDAAKQLEQFSEHQPDSTPMYDDTRTQLRRLRQELEPVIESSPAVAQDSAVLQVSLNGGETYQPAPNGVRIIFRDVLIPGEDGKGSLYLNATTEGLITDVWTNANPTEHNIGTSSETVRDIVSRLVEDNA